MTINLELAEQAKKLIVEYFGSSNEKMLEKLANIKFDIATSTSRFNRKDIVYINPRSLNDLSIYVHELLHVISTSSSFNKQYIGLHKKYIRKIGDDLHVETSMGYALNEGATEYYTREIVKGQASKAPGHATYNFCSNIYKNLEKVITGQSLKILYANGNVDNFIKVLAFNARSSEENALKLILNLDAFFDTYRIYDVFLLNPQSADVKHLLTNTYTYLAAILYDNAKARGREFNIWESISPEYLNKDELKLFAEVIKNVDISKIKHTHATLKEYDRLAMHLLTEQNNGTFKNFDIVPDHMKCGEFYNYLLLNTQFCDANWISCDIKTKDEKAKLTRYIFNPKFGALNEDKYLPQNVATILSTRYAVRAGTNTNDYYMEKCLKDNKFRIYINESDPDYYEALCDMVKAKQSQNDEKVM